MYSMFDRREFLKGLAATAGAALGGCRTFGGRARRFALNPPTVKGYGLTLKEQVRLAVAAGFDGLEPWLRDAHAAKASGELSDAVKMARDGGLAFVNGIAFGTWVDEDPAKRAAGIPTIPTKTRKPKPWIPRRSRPPSDFPKRPPKMKSSRPSRRSASRSATPPKPPRTPPPYGVS